MSDNFGTGVSRTLDPTATQFEGVVFIEGAALCDADLNLVGQLAEDWQRKLVLRGTPSGWLGNSVNQSKVYITDPSYSNWFQFGPQRAGDQQSIMWAVVNGWLIPVCGTQTGSPPGQPNNSSTLNRILLPPPPVSAGSARADFVFLECYKALISPNPSTLNKPNASAIYRFGNLEGGQSYLPDDLIDPEIGEPTTDRTQILYRIRVVSGLNNLSISPDGFDPSVVFAQGASSSPIPTYTFSNMRELLGDNGLYRAGDGNPGNSLGTVDGFAYAIPIAIIFRRSATLWSGDPFPNLNGSFNRNPSATDRFGATTFSTIPTLASLLTATATNITLVSIANIPLPASPASAVVIQIGDELLTYASITSTTIAVVRGVNGTVAEAHPAGTVVRVISSRPDGLFADQITETDLLDLRHVVSSTGFDYQALLQSSLDKLLRGKLRSTHKRSGTDPRGTYVHFEDKISQTPPAIPSITALDAPDHIRFAFSDAAIQQPVEFIVKPITAGPTFPLAPPTPPFATQAVTWDLQLANPVMAVSQKAASIWSSETVDGDGTGDTLQVDVTQFKTSLPGSDADQVRFLNEVPVSSSSGTSMGSFQFIDGSINFLNLVYPGDTIVIFTGAAKGSYPITDVTNSVLTSSISIPTASSITYIIRRGVGSVQIRIEGSIASLPQHRFEVTPHNPGPTDDLVVRFIGAGSPFPTTSSSAASQLYITTNIQYGGGRGIARRPDSIHNVVLVNPSANPEVLIQPSYEVSDEYELSTSWVLLWSKFRNYPYKSLLPVTTGSYIDPGSKSVVLQPFQSISFPSSVLYLTAGNIMPPLLSGYGPMASDPLGLFSTSNYVTLPRHLVPGFGAVYAPILPGNSADFSQGINFMLMSKEGLTFDNPDYINYTTLTTTCAIFSTLVPYNTASGAPLRAGMRHFNDDPTIGGALSTARGLGRQGLELPIYYGISRLFAIYEAGDYTANGSAFNIATDRTPLTSGGAKNLLRQSFDGPVFWIERDDLNNGVSTFILNSDAIDISKAPHPPSSFAVGDYVIEASVFGFGIGSFDLNQPFRLALSSAVTPAQPIPGPNTILPGPLPATATALVNYSRSVYQGDPWQTSSSSGLDIGYQRGPLDSATAFELASTSLTVSTLTRPNQKPLEVLASIGFITSLGTGRLSGDFVQPNTYEPRNVGYEDPVDPSGVRPYPPTVASGGASTPRPITKLGAIGSSSIFSDLEANPDYLGLTTRLPLGALYRDMDFHGGRFSDDFASPLIYTSNTGVGSGVAGLGSSTTLDQTETSSMPSETSAGLPGDVIILVDGSQSYSSLTNFRTNRGGSAFIGSGDRPGGEIFATYERILGSVSGTRALVGRAFLVRNSLTSVGSAQVSAGDELMMAIVTNVMELNTTPSEAMILLGTNGSGESVSGADLYRIEGHPLLANHTFYNVDPTTIDLPIGKTISQIVDPPAIESFPKGAPNTVYASNGTYNFWSNAPTLTALFLTNDLSVGGTASIAGDVLISSNALTFTNASHISTSNRSSGTTSTLIISTGDGTGTASTGNLTVASGTSSGSGTAGGLVLVGGSSTGSSGNGGGVTLAGGTTFDGNGGNVAIRGGTAGVGNGGDVTVSAGLGTITNGTVSVRIGPLVTVASFTNTDLILGPSNSGNYGIHFTAETTNTTIDQDDALTGNGSELTIKSQVAAPGNNDGGGIRIVAGQSTGSGRTGTIQVANGLRSNLLISATDTESAFFDHNITELGDPNAVDVYSLTFSSRVLAPKIGQKSTNGDGETLTIKSADVATAFQGKGGDLGIFAGNALGDVSHPHPGGDIYLKAGKGSFSSMGKVFLQVENGTTMSPSPVTVMVVGVDGVHLYNPAVTFDENIGNPIVISQADVLTGSFGENFKIQAQNGKQLAGSSQDGGGLFLISGKHGPSGGADGAVNLYLGSEVYPILAADRTGLAFRGSSSGNNGFGLVESSANPPAMPNNCTSAIFSFGSPLSAANQLRYSDGSSVTRYIEGVTERVVVNSTSIINPITSANPVISASPVLLSAFPQAFTVEGGDLLEGTVIVHLVAAASAGNIASFYLILVDGVTPVDITTYQFPMDNGVDVYLTVPFSYTVSNTNSGTVSIKAEAAVSGGSLNVTTPSNGDKWLFAKHIVGAAGT